MAFGTVGLTIAPPFATIPGMEENSNAPADSRSPLEPLGSCPANSNFSPLEYYRPPRLGIIHFLAWMILAALLLSSDFSVYLDPYGPLSQHQTAMKICRAAVDVILPALLVGGGILLIDCFRKKAGAFQPGH